MLGDIAPIISLLHTARLHQQTPIRQNLAKHLLYQKSHSLNWFQRAPICMKKTNIGTQVPILATHFFPFRNFFIFIILLCLFLPIPLCFFALWEKHPLPVLSSVFSAQNTKIRTPEWLGIFNSRSVLYKNSKILFWKDQKKETFFPTKKCQYKKFPIKIMM